jgi:cyclomaltodextrinase / maltogenic alpha-amylase / neopullulanase
MTARISRSDRIDSLRCYHIMVPSYRNGRPELGFGCGRGPSHHKGDLQGITEAIEPLRALGINALMLTPIFDSGGSSDRLSTGYFPHNYFAVDPHFGSEQDFRTLVDTAHRHGLAVFLDGSFGHHNNPMPATAAPGRARCAPSRCTVPDPFGLGFLGLDFSDRRTVDFMAAVATYWIDKFGIDGWRADQAYQVHLRGRNCWDKIVGPVRTSSRARRARGHTWGTLGYMCGEIWRSEYDIKTYGYGDEDFQGLDSCFDFPLRYRLVQALASEEVPINKQGMRKYGLGTEVLKRGLDFRNKLPRHAHPNLMIGNHDLLRLGNLIARCPGLGYGREHPDYWKRHRLAIAFLAATSGPITLYYGDEIGDVCAGYLRHGDLGYKDSNVARTCGRFAGSDPRFGHEEVELANYVASLLHLRAATPALWKGTRRTLAASGNLFLEEKSSGNERLLFAMNIGVNRADVEVAEPLTLTDALTGQRFVRAKTRTWVELDGLSARFLQVEP